MWWTRRIERSIDRKILTRVIENMKLAGIGVDTGCLVFREGTVLQAAINRYLTEHNQQPKPFIWTADPDDIIAAVKRGHQVLDSIH